jgi:hypothetical protein
MRDAKAGFVNRSEAALASRSRSSRNYPRSVILSERNERSRGAEAASEPPAEILSEAKELESPSTAWAAAQPKDFIRALGGAGWDSFTGCFAALSMTGQNVLQHQEPGTES